MLDRINEARPPLLLFSEHGSLSAILYTLW